jgi:hypothetical protein
MELAYPWLQVIPAVSDEPTGEDVMYGTVPELAAMIAKIVQVLRDRDARGQLVRYDPGGFAD